MKQLKRLNVVERWNGMTQFSIYDQEIYTQNNLTPRQWKFYTFLKEQREPFKKQEDMLATYETWLLENCEHSKYSYGYFNEKKTDKHYSNFSSARAMRKTIEALRWDDTIQKIIGTNKIASSVDEAKKILAKRKAKWLKEAKLYWKELQKLEKDFQTRLVFGQERDYIEAVIRNE